MPEVKCSLTVLHPGGKTSRSLGTDLNAAADYCSNAILKSIDEMNPDFNISETLERIDCMTVVPNAEAYYPEDDKPRFGMLSYPYTPCRIYSEAMTGL